MRTQNNNEVWIVDYGAGNIGSLMSAIRNINLSPRIASNDSHLIEATNIIFPGVGASKPAMETLNKTFSKEVLDSLTDASKKVLGICLGMQLFMEKSFENIETECLNFLEGDVVKIPLNKQIKVPRIGWYPIYSSHPNSSVFKIGNENLENHEFYFAHSYYVNSKNEDECFYRTSDLGIPAIVKKGNLIGVQFHPEKSGPIGLRLLHNLFGSG